MNVKSLVLASAATCVPASAALANDFYGAIFAGPAFSSDTTLEGEVDPPGGDQTVELEFGTDYVIGLAIGRNFLRLGRNNVRGELEVSYQDNNVDSLDFSGNGAGPEINVDGDVQKLRIFANALMDFDTGSALTPYVGGGLGVAFTDFDVVYGPGVALDDNDTSFALQVIAGTSYEIAGGAVFGDVRYIVDFSAEADRFAPTGALTGTVGDDLEAVNLNFGYRFNF